MRQLGESGDEPDSGAFPPVRVFLVLMSVIVAVGAVVLATREDEPPPQPPTQSPSPNFALTDAEAIARFKELRPLHLSAYRDRDLSVLSLVFTPESDVGETVTREIRRLLRDEVVAKPRYVRQKLSLLNNSSTEIRLVETVRFTARFFDESGNDITVGPAPETQVISWTLRPYDTKWFIDESEILRSKQVMTKR